MTSRAEGQRRVYHIRFSPHLLNTYTPNQLYPELGLRWSDEDWKRHLDMVRAFGFNVFQFALEPRVLPDLTQTDVRGKAFRRQMTAVTAYARDLGMHVCMLAPLTVVDGRTLCPADPDDLGRIREAWTGWLSAFPAVSMVGIGPGTGSGCSRNGCTALTYLDAAAMVAELVSTRLPKAAIELHTWGPPFLGWGSTGWDRDPARGDRALEYLVSRLPHYPTGTTVAINLGFNPDGDPEPEAQAWARRIAAHAPIVTWDLGLGATEGPVLPRWGLDRVEARRRAEMETAPYAGGLHATSTPLLNQLAAFVEARSFLEPEHGADETARTFLQGMFGTQGRAAADTLSLLDGGARPRPRGELRKRMAELLDLLSSLTARPHGPFHPEPEAWRKELVFFARLARDLCDRTPDYDELRQRYWYRVYRIHDRHPEGVDPHPGRMADALIRRFRDLPD